MSLKKWSDACDSFSRAVEALFVPPPPSPPSLLTYASRMNDSTEQYGELAPEAGEALMLYGKALLNNFVASSDVLGGGGEESKKAEEAVGESLEWIRTRRES